MNAVQQLFGYSDATFSDCKTYRYLLERRFAEHGLVFTYVGVNPSTANNIDDDQTSKKWIGFGLRNGAGSYFAVNPFAYVTTDVSVLASAADPAGPENERYIDLAIAKADILVPCWGSRTKLPSSLRGQLDTLMAKLLASGKPVRVFGKTASGDPMHPQMLAYSTPLVEWS